MNDVMICTIFGNSVKNITKPKYVKVDSVLESIKKCNIQKRIDEMLSIEDLKKRKEYKTTLPNICFSGKFTTRTDKDITEHSGLAIFDIDHIGTPIEVEKYKEKIKILNYVYACFVSPSRDGLKILVRIPADEKRHRGHYKSLMTIFPQNDPTSINPSRVCFGSSDANIYINKEAIEYTEYLEVFDAKINNTVEFKAVHTDYSKAQVVIKMIREAISGHKHSTLLKASKLTGGYIGGGIIDE